MKPTLIARLPVLFYLITGFVLRLFAWLPGFYKRPRNLEGQRLLLGIEAGIQGWNSIEFKELYQSSCEYFGEAAIVKLAIDRSKPYLPQVAYFLAKNPLTHYLYDPRTGRAESEQTYWTALVDSVSVAVLLARFRVVPVVYLTDLAYRLWRCQAAAVSSVEGVVVTFMMPRRIQAMFPHRRLVGPCLMPFSIQTLRYLEALKTELISHGQVTNVVRFTGSLYEPRATFLKNFKAVLADKADIRGRELGTQRQTDETYWTWIASVNIVITTADQFFQPGADMRHVPHLIYRYLEVLAAGSLLLAPAVPGIERYFVPGCDFVAFSDLEDATNKASYYLEHEAEAKAIAAAGHAKAAKLIESHIFWMQIDTALGSRSLFR
ncbi:MAG: hypothetical protein RIR18_703 [Pseudomonadota bacterium]|jgi:hypothetical protein